MHGSGTTCNKRSEIRRKLQSGLAELLRSWTVNIQRIVSRQEQGSILQRYATLNWLPAVASSPSGQVSKGREGGGGAIVRGRGLFRPLLVDLRTKHRALLRAGGTMADKPSTHPAPYSAAEGGLLYQPASRGRQVRGPFVRNSRPSPPAGKLIYVLPNAN